MGNNKLIRTITTEDTGIRLIDLKMGKPRRKALDMEILNGTKSFRDAVREMWSTVDYPTFEEAIEIVDDIQFDPFFKEFYQWVQEKKYPMTVLSSGLVPLLEHFFKRELKEYDLELVANGLKIHPSHWEIIYLDDSHYGHDKGTRLREYKKLGTSHKIVFIGDGVSDMPAAREAHLIFARKGYDLETYCKRENIPYHGWTTFKDIMEILHSLE
ncbi:hypothetical protein HK103_004023 [Boothiomyces macroporosus]|uniref:2-hydroxy-3-keto-5-methylthiopentenyl-1-phosphate phosphatase n=1 Tax=Boothiomyces macroporosus TaxID=261099 RepID=A0AAD5UKB0_9FUNG|nr:hypothetical protein HK103_004023 [Boothiomyces macroporosus]